MKQKRLLINLLYCCLFFGENMLSFLIFMWATVLNSWPFSKLLKMIHVPFFCFDRWLHNSSLHEQRRQSIFSLLMTYAGMH